MESNVALLHAASGLERLMTTNKNNGILQDSNVAQISAALYYQSHVLLKLESNSAFINKFHNIVFDQLDKDFGLYVDSLARVKPKSFHHVYEWNKTGSPAARLFTLRMIPTRSLSFRLDYEFLPSKAYVPGSKSKKKYKFREKASVMESGMPVTISPRSSKRLVFEIDGEVVFMPEGASVVVRSPGGKAVKNQFTIAYARFFSSDMASLSIKKSGFTRLFGSAMTKALAIPTGIKKVQYSFSPNAIRSQADVALTQAFGGAML